MLVRNNKSLSFVFFLTSVVFLIVLAISPFKDYFSQWRGFQKKFNRLQAEQPRRMTPVDVSIKQIWIPELGVTDRCTSCHLGVSNEKLVNMPEPFEPHTEMHHTPEDFGCTTCHQGQGIATTVEESVGKVEFWDDPMLPLPFVEAGCGSCHKEDNVPDANILTLGRELIKKKNCGACHTLPEYTPEFVPQLDGIGKKRSRDWIKRWLQNPKEVRLDARMPSFALNDEEVNVLTDFLLTFDSYTNDVVIEELPEELKEEWPDDDLVDLGTARFREARCISCHSIDGKGGHLAPEIGKIASGVTREWLYNYIRNPKKLLPGVPMPRYGFSKQETIAITAYMLTEFQDWEIEEDSVQVEYIPEPDFYQKGLALFNEYNCMGCHALNAKGAGKNMGPDLSNIGSKPQTEIEFGDTKIEHTRSSYLYHKVDNPSQFLENSRMPFFDFTKEELQAVTTALLATRKNSILDKYLPVSENQSHYNPQGEFGKLVDKYNCFSCHVINGEGYLLATDLSLEGSRVKYDWMKDYFKIPYTLRPILTERMPNLFMTESEREFLSDYISMLFVNDEIDDVEIPQDTSSVSYGQKLTHEIYGCVACHQVNGKGGYVGPPLNETGKRATPGWIFNWIKNPQKYRPDTIDPNQGLSDDDAKKITSYIMSLE